MFLFLDQIMNRMLEMWIFRVDYFCFLKFICFFFLLNKIIIICYVYCLWSWYVGWWSYTWRSLDVFYLIQMITLTILSKRTFYLISIWAFYFIILRISLLIILRMPFLIVFRMLLLIVVRMSLLIIRRTHLLMIIRVF